MSQGGQGSATVEQVGNGYVVNVQPDVPNITVHPPKPNTINIIIDIPALAAAIVSAQAALLKPYLEQVAETINASKDVANAIVEHISAQQHEGE